MIAVTFLIGVPLASPAVTMEDHVGVTTTVLLSAGASMVIREKIVRYLRILPPVIQVTARLKIPYFYNCLDSIRT